MRQEVKARSHHLNDDMIRVRENIDQAWVTGSKDGIVLLKDILDVCASAQASVTGGT